MITVDGQSAESPWIGRRLPDGVQYLHVSDVVDVQRFLQTNDQASSVQFDRQDRVGVAVVADLGALFEVADLKKGLGLQFINSKSIVKSRNILKSRDYI